MSVLIKRQITIQHDRNAGITTHEEQEWYENGKNWNPDSEPIECIENEVGSTD